MKPFSKKRIRGGMYLILSSLYDGRGTLSLSYRLKWLMNGGNQEDTS